MGNANEEAKPFIRHDDGNGSDGTDSKDTETRQYKDSADYQYIRYFFLFALCLQNSSYTLLRRWSTGILVEKVSDSSVLIGGELMKIVVSMLMTFCGPSFGINIGNMPMPNGQWAHFEKIIKTSPKMFVPAF